MCGIFGYCGKQIVLDTLIQGLKSLEYRGYDSAGLAFINKKNEILIHKESGKVDRLQNSIKNKKQKFCIGIAHTRWATHGQASKKNAHPHISYGKNFAIVHNGIIENYEELKNKFLKDINIVSDTDSEIVAHLLEKFYQQNCMETIKQIFSLIKGSFSLAILCKFEPQRLFLVKKSSPIMLGISSSGTYFSSDVNGLNLFCRKFIKLEDGDIAILEKQTYQIYNKNRLVKRNINKFTFNDNKSNNVKCYMEKEIAESGKAIWNTTTDFKNQFKKIPIKFFKNIDKIYLVGCGTAFHSCLVGKYFLENYYKIPIICEIASEFIYSKPRITNKTLCIFVSQSGETADTLLSLKLAKKLGGKIFAITNNETSSITFESKYSLIMRAGWEKAVASTKAYVCQLACFYLLSYHLNQKLDIAIQNLKKLVKTINEFDYEQWVLKVSKILPNFEKIIFIGRLLSYTTSMEASLKLKEITYINSIACPSGELKHGTLALVDEKTIVIAILCEKNLIEKNTNTIKEVFARNGNLIVLSPFKENINHIGKNNLILPDIDYELLPFISILPFQKLSCEISKNLGFNPDMPKNLSKSVTVE